MQQSFYVSGILYHLKTQQLLLHQPQSQSGLWESLGGKSKEGEKSIKTFQRIVHELSGIKLKEENIYPVYDYFHTSLDTTHYVLYAEVDDMSVFSGFPKEMLGWFTFKQTLKLSFHEQTKQDIVVTQRVIHAEERRIDKINNPPLEEVSLQK